MLPSLRTTSTHVTSKGVHRVWQHVVGTASTQHGISIALLKAASDTTVIQLKPFEESQCPDSEPCNMRHNNKGILQAFFNLTRSLLYYYFASQSSHHLVSFSICPSLSAATPFDVRASIHHVLNPFFAVVQSGKALYFSCNVLVETTLLLQASTFPPHI